MGEKEKVTIMVLKVDLQCQKCYKKVKKVLCKFPQIRDQKYDEKQNQVEIKVVSCSPEKIRDKIYCKGGCAIKCIKFKAHETEPTKDGKKDNGKPKGDETLKKDNGKPKIVNGKPTGDEKREKDDGKKKDNGKPKGDEKPKKDNGKPKIVNGKPTGDEKREKDDGKKKDNGKPTGDEGRPCYSGCGGQQCHCRCGGRQCYCRCGGRPCYSGCGGQPCYSGYVERPAPYIQYDGYYGRPVYDNYSGDSRGYCVTHTNYFSEENPSACTVM
ncbi:heavy metal-associated isoprenylated plant protein 5-like [Pyrus communis]|uniref:heavy metal-associated isoprenylated plant protein 5-like n=1 Tax=Pyrus communis TaxID=23211 RepID=UPI0035BF6E26